MQSFNNLITAIYEDYDQTYDIISALEKLLNGDQDYPTDNTIVLNRILEAVIEKRTDRDQIMPLLVSCGAKLAKSSNKIKTYMLTTGMNVRTFVNLGILDPNEILVNHYTTILNTATITGYAAAVHLYAFGDLVEMGGDVWTTINNRPICDYILREQGPERVVGLFHRGLVVPPSRIKHFEASDQQDMLYRFI
jgi:hypothetical protein